MNGREAQGDRREVRNRFLKFCVTSSLLPLTHCQVLWL